MNIKEEITGAINRVEDLGQMMLRNPKVAADLIP